MPLEGAGEPDDLFFLGLPNIRLVTFWVRRFSATVIILSTTFITSFSLQCFSQSLGISSS